NAKLPTMVESTEDKLTPDVTAFLEPEEGDTGAGTDTLVVLIEIDLPRPVFTPSTQSGEDDSIPGRGRFSDVPDEGEIATRVEQANTELEKILGRSLHWLAAPHVFVGELTREELRTIAPLAFVKQIHKNRNLVKGNTDADSTLPE
nr:hypothetical protein [Gammaproteobacteria bacterium]